MSTIAPYQPTFRDALRETGQYLTGGIRPMEAGLSTTVATEPIKNWAEQQGPVGRFASNLIPGNREEVIGAAAQAALLAMTMGGSGAAGVVGAGRTGGAGIASRPVVTPMVKATPGALLEDPKRYASFMRSLGKPQKFSDVGEAIYDTFKPWGAWGADFETPLIEHVKKGGLGLAMDAAANINKIGPQNWDDAARRLRVAFGGRDYLNER